ncbi:hypothetical protein PR001_g23392 [Phytophthora rubi]|uniref:PX domain-containing protein n=1 Tax=Phytophthora rubi TaxID=129364 RepID=A0A6A3IW80_9STRA|nr:hypothetical protein PR001_g23392 [Phytophthora rubi]
MSRLVVAIGHVEFTGGSQVLYVVKVQQDADEWEVRRTYSDFRKLRDDVQRVMKDARAHILDDACSREFSSELQELSFPAKRLFGSRKDHVVKERAVELHRFLIKLLFLTHTYRKAQKARYDQYVQALPTHQQAAYAALQDRTQASVSVFHLLRDFLKPVTIKTDVPPHSGDLLGSSDGAFHDANEQRESSPKRLIRESKILAMRSSNASERKHPQSSKEADKMQQHKRREQQVEHARKLTSEAVDPANDSAEGDKKQKQQQPSGSNNTSKTVRMNDLMAASVRSRTEANSLRQQFLQKQHSASVAEESLRDQFMHKQNSTSALANEHRMQRHYSTPEGHAGHLKNRTARAATSTSTTTTTTLSSVASSSHDESEPEKEKLVAVASSVPSSTSSTASADEVKLVDLSSLDQYKTKKSPRRDSHSSDKSKSSRKSSSKEQKEKSSTRNKEKKTSRIKRKAKSAKNIQMTDYERMSRVSSALNAQAISINAQRELEKYISEYSAIMILRYVDRFINKAIMKAPGCYRVNAHHRLVIDSQRFLQELEDTFTDLPINFGDLFQTDHDEWAFPPALDKYVQLKWDSFQSSGSNSISHDNGHSSAADQTSDSDDSDTDYEYEEVGGGGFMTAKQTFSNDEESMLQEMIANGTAGREQMLRLRRQINEQGWNRRENPGSRSQRMIEEVSSSESEDEEALSRQREKRRSKRRDPKQSVSCVVEKYQQEQNARRKDRLQSFGGPSIGGFV